MSITTDAHSAMNQSELEASYTCDRRQARESGCEQVTNWLWIYFSLVEKVIILFYIRPSQVALDLIMQEKKVFIHMQTKLIFI